MTALQTAAIITLAFTAALRVLMFDKRGRTHKPKISALAYLIFVQMALTALSAAMKTDHFTVWLLIFSLAVHTGAIIRVGGNINRIYPANEL
ncbi:MAG: phage holin family protein [Neisseria sp.]|nr:phage holin family protein [Neisseria sp.]